MSARGLTRTEATILLVAGGALLVLSGIHPYDRATWWLEVAPILIAVPILAATVARFPLTPLVYRLIFLHALVLMIGGHYTYARVPLGFWAEQAFGLGRNHYDRLGHLMQGFVPAMVAREVILRRTPLPRGGWLFTFVTALCLAISACYEFVEWWSALIMGQGATEFLGTQGDPWDTQWDMFLCLCGAILAQILLARAHDREIGRLSET